MAEERVPIIITLEYGEIATERELAPADNMPVWSELVRWIRQVRDPAHSLTGFSIREKGGSDVDEVLHDRV